MFSFKGEIKSKWSPLYRQVCFADSSASESSAGSLGAEPRARSSGKYQPSCSQYVFLVFVRRGENDRVHADGPFSEAAAGRGAARLPLELAAATPVCRVKDSRPLSDRFQPFTELIEQHVPRSRIYATEVLQPRNHHTLPLAEGSLCCPLCSFLEIRSLPTRLGSPFRS